MKDTDIAWVAGLLEGEGCFGTQNKSSPKIQVAMTDYDVLLKFVKILNLGTHRIHTHNRKTSAWKTCYAVTIHGIPAIELMEQILPYMGVRRTAKIEEVLAKAKSARFYALRIINGK